jgi:hypothetical protein
MVALRSKRIETRSWRTHYRGPIAIHAAKRALTKIEREECFTPWCRSALRGPTENLDYTDPADWPMGAIVAAGLLSDCIPTEDVPLEVKYAGRSNRRTDLLLGWNEDHLGDFNPNRYAWMLTRVNIIPKPIPCRGRQGLFTVEIPDEKVWWLP